jgi:hypothetical protein
VDPSRQMRNIAAELVATFRAGTADAFPDLTGEVPCPVLPSSAKSTADYQFNGAMAISGLLKVSTTGTVIILIFLTLFHRVEFSHGQKFSTGNVMLKKKY